MSGHATDAAAQAAEAFHAAHNAAAAAAAPQGNYSMHVPVHPPTLATGANSMPGDAVAAAMAAAAASAAAAAVAAASASSSSSAAGGAAGGSAEDPSAATRRHANLPNELRATIIRMSLQGYPATAIASSLNVKAETARKIVRRYQTTGEVERRPKGGNHRTDTVLPEQLEMVLALKRQNKNWTLKQIQAHVLEQQSLKFNGRKLSLSTISRLLTKEGLGTGKKRAKRTPSAGGANGAAAADPSAVAVPATLPVQMSHLPGLPHLPGLSLPPGMTLPPGMAFPPFLFTMGAAGMTPSPSAIAAATAAAAAASAYQPGQPQQSAAAAAQAAVTAAAHAAAAAAATHYGRPDLANNNNMNMLHVKQQQQD